MGQTARDHAEKYLDQARDNVERAIQEGDFTDSEAAHVRTAARLDAVEYLVRRLAGDIDRLEAK